MNYLHPRLMNQVEAEAGWLRGTASLNRNRLMQAMIMMMIMNLVKRLSILLTSLAA